LEWSCYSKTCTNRQKSIAVFIDFLFKVLTSFSQLTFEGFDVSINEKRSIYWTLNMKRELNVRFIIKDLLSNIDDSLINCLKRKKDMAEIHKIYFNPFTLLLQIIVIVWFGESHPGKIDSKNENIKKSKCRYK
jgi:hypothetical protein